MFFSLRTAGSHYLQPSFQKFAKTMILPESSLL
jgi:hypothetical protein